MAYLPAAVAQRQNNHLCTLKAWVRVHPGEKQMFKRVIDKSTQQIVVQSNVLAPKQCLLQKSSFYNCDLQMLSQHQ
jgi:hypothetical protein